MGWDLAVFLMFILSLETTQSSGRATRCGIKIQIIVILLQAWLSEIGLANGSLTELCLSVPQIPLFLILPGMWEKGPDRKDPHGSGHCDNCPNYFGGSRIFCGKDKKVSISFVPFGNIVVTHFECCLHFTVNSSLAPVQLLCLCLVEFWDL